MFAEAPQPSLVNHPCVDTPSGLMVALRGTQPVCLIDEPNKNLYKLFIDNLVRGPSIVFHRYQESRVTCLKHQEMGKESKMCERVLGVHANALYLWCLMQDMPTGYPTRRRAEDQFTPLRNKKQSKVAHGWLEYMTCTEKIEIRHAYRGGEMRVGRHEISVDGFCA